MPAKAGIQFFAKDWAPACAGTSGWGMDQSEASAAFSVALGRIAADVLAESGR
jgi:hypothetical protein